MDFKLVRISEIHLISTYLGASPKFERKKVIDILLLHLFLVMLLCYNNSRERRAHLEMGRCVADFGGLEKGDNSETSG